MVTNVQNAIASDLRILYRRPRPNAVKENVWSVRESGIMGSEERLVCSIRIEGSCYSVHTPLESGGKPLHHVGCRGTPLWEENGVRIISRKSHVKFPHKCRGTSIRVRFNTEHLRDDHARPWRILLWDGGKYAETLVDTFVISGSSYSTYEILPEEGEKWHIGCEGHVLFHHDHASIFSHE